METTAIDITKDGLKESSFISFATFEDFQKFIIDAVVEDIKNNGPIRQAFIAHCAQ